MYAYVLSPVSHYQTLKWAVQHWIGPYHLTQKVFKRSIGILTGDFRGYPPDTRTLLLFLWFLWRDWGFSSVNGLDWGLDFAGQVKAMDSLSCSSSYSWKVSVLLLEKMIWSAFGSVCLCGVTEIIVIAEVSETSDCIFDLQC